MALFAIGDLHLSFSGEKRMERFGELWKNHDKKIEKCWKRGIKEEDTVVVTGDHAWGNHLNSCREELAFISSLPGKKVLLRGNHDYFWDVKKTARYNEEYQGKLFFLQNNFFPYNKEYAIVGTKGICDEGRDTREHFEMIRQRELDRLRRSFTEAERAGYDKFIVCLHYPPTDAFQSESLFTELIEQYSVKALIYSHLHSEEHFYESLLGEVRGVTYHLVSSDYLGFHPKKIL